MTEAGPVANVALTQDHRCQLKKGSRERLEKLKLIEVEWVSRRIVLTLSEKGWAHCRSELAAGSVPAGSGAIGGALYAVLRRWDRFLAAQQLSLGEFVTASTASAASTPSASTPSDASIASATSTAPTATDAPAGVPKLGEQAVEERLLAAYRTIAPSAGDPVSLADLRDLVNDLSPVDVDAALRRLHRQRRVTLVPEANQKTLDARTKAAAVVIGDQPKHSIEMAAS